MKLTLGEAREISVGLPEVMKEKLPTKMGYWFARTLREIGTHMQDMEEVRKKLLGQFALKDKKGEFIEKKGQYVFKNQKAFQEEFVKLAEQEIEIKYNGVTLEELEEITGKQECPECKKEIPSKVIFKGLDLFNLGKLILDPPEDSEKTEEKQK